MPTIFRSLPAAVLLLAGLLVTTPGAAAEADPPRLDQGKLQSLVTGSRFRPAADLLDAARVGPAGVPVEALYLACEAWLKVRRFGAASACFERMDREGAQAASNPLLAISPLYFQLKHQAGAAELALELGRNQAALAAGERAYQLLASGKIKPQGLIGGLYSLFDFGGAATIDLGHREAVPVLGVLAVAQARLGNAAAARRHLEELERHTTSAVGNRAAEAQALPRYWMTFALLELRDYEGAYRASLPADSPLQFVYTTMTALAKPVSATMGQVFSYDYDEAQRYGIVELESARARALVEAGKWEQARAYLDALLADPRIDGFGAIHHGLLYDRARVALATGDPAAALPWLTRAVDALEAQRASIHDEAGKIGHAGGKQRIYVDLVRTLLALGRADEALAYAERGKARALVDLLAGRDVPGGGSAPRAPEEAARVRQLESGLAAAEAGTEGTRSARNLVLAARESLERADPEVASLVAVVNPDLAAVQALLGPDEALVEYFGDESALFAFVLNRGGVKGRALDGRGLAAALRAWREALAQPDSAAQLPRSQALYDRLLRPLEAWTGAPRLVIVPHGALHYAPFAALHDGSGYLVEKKTLRLLPAAGVQRYLRPRPLEGQLLALGNPDLKDARLDLPGAQREVERIHAARPAASVFLRGEASEARLKQLAPRHRLLHLASHGVFRPDAPLSSALLLAPAEGDDGALTAAELYDLKLDAALVVLSACETGLGDVRQGDDVVGLNRGFLFAGASRVLSSLWEVDDAATSELMLGFYAGLGGGDAAASLRAAQLALMATRPQPYYWAAFQLTGAR